MTDQLAIDHLASLRNDDGGFPPTRGGESEPEPTALAALALDDAHARAWLEKHQREDGGFTVGPESLRSDASTPLAALALPPGPAQNRAIDYMLAHQAERLGRDDRFPHDAETSGWGWTSLTFGWVEPTARALHAVKLLSPNSDGAIRDGRRVLEDRECVGGGWNYGNRVVLGRELEPYLQTTAVAVVALHDEENALRERGVAVLDLLWPREQGGLGWSMTLAALRLCSAPSDRLAAGLAEYVAETRLFDDAVALAWAVMALGEGVERLRVSQ